ncbi:hypothetical protein B7494_g8066 [Chlorociboria aeruginascens]|nr:hypothetical protein B7494_g8066 [Chlorociboria aeruginascens]
MLYDSFPVGGYSAPDFQTPLPLDPLPIKIIVGLQGRVRYLPELALCNKSTWFQRYLRGNVHGLSEHESMVQNAFTERQIFLPSEYAMVFDQFADYIEGKAVRSYDTGVYDSGKHISEWCLLHVFAKKFGCEELARTCLEMYRCCRIPHVCGIWMPLHSEIRYLYQEETFHLTAALRKLIVDHMRGWLLSLSFKGDMRDLVSLVSSHGQLTYDVFVGIRTHLLPNRQDRHDRCSFQNCGVHIQVDNVAPTPAPSTTDSPTLSNRTNNTTDDEEAYEAYEAAERLNAIADFEQYRQSSQKGKNLKASGADLDGQDSNCKFHVNFASPLMVPYLFCSWCTLAKRNCSVIVSSISKMVCNQETKFFFSKKRTYLVDWLYKRDYEHIGDERVTHSDLHYHGRRFGLWRLSLTLKIWLKNVKAYASGGGNSVALSLKRSNVFTPSSLDLAIYEQRWSLPS